MHSQETKTAHFPAAGIWRPIQTKGNLPQRRKTGLIGRNRIGGIGKPSGNDRGEPGISPVIGDGRSQDIEIHTGFQKSSKDIRLFRIMADPGSHRLSCTDQRPWRQSAGKWKDSRESFLLPVGASQSGRRNALPRCGPVSSEQREPCAFLACAASLNGAMEKAGKPALHNPSARTRKGITDMGIFVNLPISTSVTQDEWTSVYEESLRENKRSSDPRKTGSKRPESASRAGSLPRDPLTQWGRK